MKARNRSIRQVALINIAANILLVVFKMLAGLLSNSVAIILGAINNLSDALSSIITLIGAKLSERKPDRKHPFGYGRIEYLVTFLVAGIVLYAGINSMQEAIARIITPESTTYDFTSLLIVSVSIVAKMVLGTFTIKRGKRLGADALVWSGIESRYDAVVSAATLASAGVYLAGGISLDGWVGAIISLLIIKAGFDILREAVSKTLGERAEAQLSQAVRTTINQIDGVHGAYDLVLYDHGPGAIDGCVHVEVDDTMTAAHMDAISRRIRKEVYEKQHVHLLAVGIYSTNTQSSKASEIRTGIADIIAQFPHVHDLHGFYLNEETETVSFDVVIGFDDKDRYATFNEICRQAAQKYPHYEFNATLDVDATD